MSAVNTITRPVMVAKVGELDILRFAQRQGLASMRNPEVNIFCKAGLDSYHCAFTVVDQDNSIRLLGCRRGASFLGILARTVVCACGHQSDDFEIIDFQEQDLRTSVLFRCPCETPNCSPRLEFVMSNRFDFDRHDLKDPWLFLQLE